MRDIGIVSGLNMLHVRNYRFALCFRVLSNQYVERSACANGFMLTAVLSHTRPPTIFPISKTVFWWTSIKRIHDNNGMRSFQNHYFNVNCQSIRVALSS